MAIKENQRRVVDRDGIESIVVTNRQYQVDAAPDLLWDYSQAAEGDRPALQAAARDIKRTARQSVQVIGAALADAKARLPHGLWGDWLAVEFEWSERTAQRIMAGAQAVGKNDKLSDLGASALYLAAAASDDAQAEIGDMASSGAGSGPAGRVTVDDVRRVVRRYTGGDDAADDAADEQGAAPPSGGVGGRTRPAASSGSGRATYIGGDTAAAGKCAVCGRPLTDPGSVGRACGPTCAAKAAAAGAGDEGEGRAPVLSRDMVAIYLDESVAERLFNAADSGPGGLAHVAPADARALARAIGAALGW